MTIRGVLAALPIALCGLAPQEAAGLPSYRAGRTALERREWKAAVGFLETAVSQDSMSATFRTWLGLAYAEQARHGTLLEQMRAAPRIKQSLVRATQLDPLNAEARVVLVEFLLRAPGVVGGDQQAAVAHVDTLTRQNAYAGAIARARVLEVAGDSALARAALRRLSSIHPDSIAPYALLLNLLSDRTGYAEAVSLAARLERRPCCRMLGRYYRGRMSLFSGKDLQAGVSALRAYLSHTPRLEEPSRAYAHWRLGQLWQRLGRRDEARREFEAALRDDPDLTGARADLARIARK